MRAFIVKVGKKVMGRLLAHDEQHARKQASGFWGREKKYDVKPVVEKKADDPDQYVDDEPSGGPWRPE